MRSYKNQQNKDNNQATRSRLRDLPEWLEEFTDNLEDTEVPVLVNTSQDSDWELPRKVVSRTHSVFSHFPKDRNCEVRKSLAGNALVMQYLEQKTLVTWCQQIAKFSVKDVNLETITYMLSWYKI